MRGCRACGSGNAGCRDWCQQDGLCQTQPRSELHPPFARLLPQTGHHPAANMEELHCHRFPAGMPMVGAWAALSLIHRVLPPPTGPALMDPRSARRPWERRGEAHTLFLECEMRWVRISMSQWDHTQLLCAGLTDVKLERTGKERRAIALQHSRIWIKYCGAASTKAATYATHGGLLHTHPQQPQILTQIIIISHHYCCEDFW